ncbi:MAG: hypothetical protein C0483_14960 [Pirellula sp.]|nr:hypothetical protein [Pirellula sp.]
MPRQRKPRRRWSRGTRISTRCRASGASISSSTIWPARRRRKRPKTRDWTRRAKRSVKWKNTLVDCRASWNLRQPALNTTFADRVLKIAAPPVNQPAITSTAETLVAPPALADDRGFLVRTLCAAWPWLIVVGALGAAGWSWASGGIFYELLRTDLEAAVKIERLQEFFRACGAWAPLVYLGFVTIEVVVAPIPGLMLYAPGGMVFGPIAGGALALAGNTLGAGLACTLAKRLGAARLERLLAVETRDQLHETIRLRGARWIFWLRLNPLTSSDMVSYAAGFAGMSAGKVMAATALGMAPLCFAQSALSDGIFRRFPELLYPLLVLCGIYVVVTVFLIRRQLVGRRPVAARSDDVNSASR